VNDIPATVIATITELSLTGNQSYETMLNSKIHWQTWDDHVVIRHNRDPIDTDEYIEVQSQRIRVFSVVYSFITESSE